MIERAITELACKNAKPEQIAALRQMVIDERDCFARGDRGMGIRLSGEFHLKLAEAAGNLTLLGFLRSLISQTSLIIALYESNSRTHCSDAEHDQVIDAIEAGNVEVAVDLMMRHMDSVDAKLNLDGETASDDLHAVFSHLLPGSKKKAASR
jgi:DNA-binding GntR family transcriptional regulator